MNLNNFITLLSLHRIVIYNNVDTICQIDWLITVCLLFIVPVIGSGLKTVTGSVRKISTVTLCERQRPAIHLDSCTHH